MARSSLQHGINGPEPPLFSRPVDPQTTPFKYMRDFSISHNKTNILEETGPYIAEVVRVFEPYLMPSNDKTIPLGYWDQFEDGAEGELIVLRVRIPEIDTFGIPAGLPDNDEDFKNLSDKDRHLVERYPKCVGKWLNMKLPKPGQAVWVDFRDPKNRAERMYLGIVNETQMAGAGAGSGTPGGPAEGTKAAFKKGGFGDAATYVARTAGTKLDVALSARVNQFVDWTTGGEDAEIKKMFAPTGGKIWIKCGSTGKWPRGLAYKRLAKFRKDLQHYLNGKFPFVVPAAGAIMPNWEVGNLGETRELKACVETTNPLRAVGSIHGVGLAADCTISSLTYKWPGTVKEQNRVLVNDPAFLKAVNDFVNRQGDIKWGGYFYKKGAIKTKTKYTDTRGRQRFLYSDEIHHFQIKDEYWAQYFEPWTEALAEIGINKPPSKYPDDFKNLYLRVIEHFKSNPGG